MDSPAVARRIVLAQRAAVAYQANPKVAAVLIAGSVARGLADDDSDIELDVYWSSAPDEADREAAVEAAGWTRSYGEVDEVEWADGYLVDGVKVDTSGFLTSTIDGYLDAALDRADTETELQVRITALLHGRSLHGHDLIQAWRTRCAVYPPALARAMVEMGLDLRPRHRLAMLAARGDVLLLHRDLVDNLQGVLDALFGLNRIFTPHPFHKWLAWEATLLPFTPTDLVGRLRRTLVAPPAEAVDLISLLVDDTFHLAEEHLPQIDLTSARASYAGPRIT
jgi:predicted nucleotidyltransferase